MRPDLTPILFKFSNDVQKTSSQYAEAMFEALVGGGGEGIRERGRARSMKFDDGVFARRFVELFEEWTN